MSTTVLVALDMAALAACSSVAIGLSAWYGWAFWEWLREVRNASAETDYPPEY